MYGVSMSKDGTTKVIGQRLDQPDGSSPPNAPSGGPIEVESGNDQAATVPEQSPVH
jgi:hypothetical protein